MENGLAQGIADGHKAGYEEGHRQGLADGMKAAWGVLNLKVGTLESSVIEWLGRPDEENADVGKAALTLRYGNVRIVTAADFQGDRRVTFFSGDVKELLERKASGR